MGKTNQHQTLELCHLKKPIFYIQLHRCAAWGTLGLPYTIKPLFAQSDSQFSQQWIQSKPHINLLLSCWKDQSSRAVFVLRSHFWGSYRVAPFPLFQNDKVCLMTSRRQRGCTNDGPGVPTFHRHLFLNARWFSGAQPSAAAAGFHHLLFRQPASSCAAGRTAPMKFEEMNYGPQQLGRIHQTLGNCHKATSNWSNYCL